MKTYSPISNAKGKALSKVYNMNVSDNFFILCEFIVFQKTFAIQLDIQTCTYKNWKGYFVVKTFLSHNQRNSTSLLTQI